METLMPLLQEAPPLTDVQRAFFSAGAAVFVFGLGAALIASLLGILFMTLVVAPNLTQRCAAALRERNFLSFLAGLPVAAVFLFLAAATRGAPILSVLFGMTFGVMLLLALASAAEDIGRRLYWACGKEGSRTAHLAAGWLVFAFGSLFPVIGWFVILPYVSLSALGSLVVGMLSSRAKESPAASVPPPRDIEYVKD